LPCSAHLILSAIPRTSESADPVPGRDVHHRSSRIFGNLTGCLRTIVPRAAIVLQKDHHDEIVDAEAGEAGQRRGARIPCEVSGYPTIRIAMEAGRIDPRRAEKVIEVYSLSIVKMVRNLVSPTSTSSVPPPCPRGRWCGHRPVYLEFLIVTVLVTLGRQSSCRVGL
jgi:hypothetical protein